ncbi:hypothetical protein vfu_A00434 [Vibrio furnissii NCTC 11218]|nr:hypothetical protein vfu_A00434 [Vibrio furnissii NCTC 11218]
MRVLVVFYANASTKRDQFNTLIPIGKAICSPCHTKVVVPQGLNSRPFLVSTLTVAL